MVEDVSLVVGLGAGLLGGGVVGVVAWGALRFHLQRDFLTVDWGERIERKLGAAAQDLPRVERIALDAQERVVRMEHTIRDEVVRELRTIARAVAQARESQAATERTLQHQSGTLARLERRLDSLPVRVLHRSDEED